jgi:hypothetical protein
MMERRWQFVGQASVVRSFAPASPFVQPGLLGARGREEECGNRDIGKPIGSMSLSARTRFREFLTLEYLS